MKLTKHPHVRLTTPTLDVDFPLSEENKIIIKNMINLMYHEKGIGLSLIHI